MYDPSEACLPEKSPKLVGYFTKISLVRRSSEGPASCESSYSNPTKLTLDATLSGFELYSFKKAPDLPAARIKPSFALEASVLALIQ